MLTQLGSISEESEDVVTGVAKLDIVSDNIIGSQGVCCCNLIFSLQFVSFYIAGNYQ